MNILRSPRRRADTLRLTTWAPLILVAVAGCGGEKTYSHPDAPKYEVKGKVLLPGGKPLTQGRVVFVPIYKPKVVNGQVDHDADTGQGQPASGDLSADGSFSLTTAKPDDGAVAGDYKVVIEPANLPPLRKGQSPPPPPFPAAFADEATTPLKVTVQAAANSLPPFTLTPVPKASHVTSAD